MKQPAPGGRGFAPGQAFAVNPAVAHREVEGQVLLLLPGDHGLFTLNESGRVVWRALARGRPYGALVATLARRFRVPPDRAERDVRALLEDLLVRGVIRRKR